MKKLVACFVVFLVFSSSYADIGFVRIDDPNLPQCFNEIFPKSIFRMSTFSKEPNQIIPSEQYRSFQESRESSSVMERIAKDIDSCIVEEKKECPIHFSSQCTSFFTGSPEHLWTNRHCIEDEMEGFNFELSSFDQGGQRYNASAFDYMIDTIGSVLMTSEKYPKKPAVVSRVDFVSFSLLQGERIEHTKLYPSFKMPELDETLFIVGYPAPTYTRHHKNPNAFDSNGFDLFVAKGKRINPYKHLLPVNIVGSRGSSEEQALDDVDIYVDTDFQKGMSGSPIVNSQCELVGIARGVTCSSGDTTFVPCSSGVSGVSMSWIKSLKLLESNDK